MVGLGDVCVGGLGDVCVGAAGLEGGGPGFGLGTIGGFAGMSPNHLFDGAGFGAGLGGVGAGLGGAGAGLGGAGAGFGGVGVGLGEFCRCCWAASCIAWSCWKRRVASLRLLGGALLGCRFLAFCR